MRSEITVEGGIQEAYLGPSLMRKGRGKTPKIETQILYL